MNVSLSGAAPPDLLELLVGSLSPAPGADRIALVSAPPVLTKMGPHGSVLAWAHGANGVLYAAEAGRVSAWRRRGDTVEPVGDTHAASASLPCHLATTADSARVIVAHYQSGQIVVHPVLTDGALGAPSDVRQLEGRGPDPDRQGSPHPHMVACRHDEVIVADLGADLLRRYRLVAGRLVETTSVRLPPGTGPRHFVLRGDRAFVVGELSNELVTVDLIAETVVGVEACASASASARPDEARYPSGVLLSADGRFCHVLIRGADSISTFRLDPAPRLVHEIATGGAEPWDVVRRLDALYVAHRRSGTITRLRIDPETGYPEGATTVADVPGAVSLILPTTSLVIHVAADSSTSEGLRG